MAARAPSSRFSSPLLYKSVVGALFEPAAPSAVTYAGTTPTATTGDSGRADSSGSRNGSSPSSRNHFVVTALNSSSNQHDNTSNNQQDLQEGLRTEDLPPHSLSDMLRVAMAATTPQKSYTFNSPGHRKDIAAQAVELSGNTSSDSSSRSSSSSTSSGTRTNGAVLHVIERVPDDYPVNNKVYYDIGVNCSVLPAAVAQRVLKLYEQQQLPSAVTTATATGTTNTSRIPPMPPVVRSAYFTAALNELQGISSSSSSSGEKVTCLNSPAVTSPYESLLTAEYPSPEQLAKVKEATQNNVSTLPVEESSSSSSASSSLSSPPAVTPGDAHFVFFPWPCDWASQVAYATRYFVVLVNLKPVVPGHLLIIPRRVMSTIHSLDAAECDEWGHVVRRCIDVLRTIYPENDGISLAIQQGILSGQTVPHLHTHVIVYREDSLLGGEPEAGNEEHQRVVRPRTKEEMAEECRALRPYFYGGGSQS